MTSSKIPPKRLSLKRTILVSAILLWAAIFSFYYLFSHFLDSEYDSKPELFFGGICLVLVIGMVLLLAGKILSPLHGLARKAETICDQKDGLQAADIQGLNDIPGYSGART